MRVRSPLPVVTAWYKYTERPAWRVRLPPVAPVGTTFRTVDRRISLEAWRMTDVPAFNWATRSEAHTVMDCSERDPKVDPTDAG